MTPRRAERIAVDLNPLLPNGENGGAATATLNLLAEIAAAGRELILLVLDHNRDAADHLVGNGVERYVVRRDAITPLQNRRGTTSWPPPWSLAGALGADVLFCPFGDPFWAEPGVPTVCTINDLQHLDHPEFFTETELGHRADYLRRLVGVADRIIAPSEFTRRSVRHHLAPDVPISVVPYPADRRWGAGEPTATVATPGRFLLYPANAWPHKNHERLLDALAVHRSRCTDSGGEPIRLICTGSPLGRRHELEEGARRRGIADLVEFRGHVHDRELRDLYRSATGVLIPSLYEGFGMPALEAMTFDVPVACSNVASLPEVVGDAAMLFDPTQPLAIADAIDSLAGDNTANQARVARGRRHVERYSTPHCVEALLAALDAAVRQDAPDRRADLPSVSVVMPSYQQADFIGRSIDSVLAQGDDAAQFIVCDGASTDGTVALLEARGDALDYVSEPDDGQAAAVNKGVAKSSGDIIGWLNSDDVYYPGALAAVRTVFAHRPDLPWAYFAADHIDPDDAVIEAYYNRPWDAAAFRDSCFICQPGTFFRRDFFGGVGELDESLRYCMDYELWIRMSRRQRPVYVPVVVAGSRLHPATKTLGQRTEVLREIVDMLSRTYSKVSQTWLLGMIGDRVDRRGWDPDDPTTSRRRHRFALAVAAETLLRHRAVPDQCTRSVLRVWARESIGRPTPRTSVRSGVGRRLVGRPYHASTRWVRRRVRWEMEPRLRSIEEGVRAGHGAIEDVRTSIAALFARLESFTPPELHLERVVFQHHQVEEALVERLTVELAEIRDELDRLRAQVEGQA